MQSATITGTKITEMLDNTKFLITHQRIIDRMLLHPDFVVCKPKNNYYHSLMHRDFGIKLSLDFRKAVESGNVIGYGHLELNISPHYHYNGYLHNGDDFTPENSVKSISDILTYLGIKADEYDMLKVVNVEFGVNIIPECNVKNLINGLYFYKKTQFRNYNFPYFKRTEATTYKQIKVYAKGLQFAEFPEYGINENTLRFEIKTKQSKNIKKYGITNAGNLLNLETYNRLSQELNNEWEQILLVNLEANLERKNTDEVDYILKANNKEFWVEIIKEKHRNTFQINKEKYCKIIGSKNDIQLQIKTKIIDKLFLLAKCANSTQPTPINRGKFINGENTQNKINLEYAHFTQNKRYCIVTGIDITDQQKGSRFLRELTLRKIKDTDTELYNELEKKYLTDKARKLPIEKQIYLICKNIRDSESNPRNNRVRFERRNYHKQQLQFNF